MSKKNFVSLIFATVGGILFALGMCMALIPAWDAFQQGVVLGAAGLAVLLIMALVRRRMAGKPVVAAPSARTVGIVLLGAAGALALGVGMCMTMVWSMMTGGVAVGIVGIILLLCLITAVKGLK